MIDTICRKYSKRKNTLDLVNAFFGAAYKSFYLWCPIDGKVSVVSVVSVSALNVGIGSSIGIG